MADNRLEQKRVPTGDEFRVLEPVGMLMGQVILMENPSPEIKEAGRADMETFDKFYKHVAEHACGERECIDRTILCDEWYLANTNFREAIRKK